MPKPSFSLSILSLFTTPERAAEIEGDLIEQAHSQGSGWFTYHVVITALSLFRAVVAKNVLLISLLSYASYELCAKVFFLGIRPLRWYLEFEIAFPRTATTSLTYALVVVFMFVVGNGLVRLLPAHGGPVALGTAALFYLRLAVLQEGYSVTQATLCVAAPIILGCLLANWLRLSERTAHFSTS
jgi:hypothetical protein